MHINRDSPVTQKSPCKGVRFSGGVIIRSFAMYKPLKFFVIMGMIPFLAGFLIGIRFLFYYFQGIGGGHVQSLILAAVLLMIGWQTVMMGLQADIIAANRKLLQDVQYRVKKLELELELGDTDEK